MRDTVTVSAPDSLTGVWTGTYVGGTFGRSGTIEIRLYSSGPAAGELVLGGVPPKGRSAAFATDAERAAFPRVGARVRGVDASAGNVKLWADPYFDTGCECTLAINFEGRLAGDTISGRFTAAGSPTMVAERDGRWRVVRGQAPVHAVAKGTRQP